MLRETERQYTVRNGNTLLLPIRQLRQSLPMGCGVACCAMVIGLKTGTNPSDQVLADRYGVGRTRGTSYEDMKKILKAEIGATCSPVQRANRGSLLAALRSGHPVVAGVTVGSAAHAIVISGIVLLDNGTTRLVVNDPNLGMALFVTAEAVDDALQKALVVQL
jgi:hypothetical protein